MLHNATLLDTVAPSNHRHREGPAMASSIETEQRTVAIIGAGTIGLSWATLFAARGLSVRVSDPRPDLEETVRAAVRELSATLPGGPEDPAELLARIAFEPDL